MPVNVTPAALLEAMSEALYVVDTNQEITYWNTAAEELTGFRANDVIGKRCSDGILNHVDENGVRLCSARCPLRATMRDGNARALEPFLHHRDGHRVPVAVRSAALRAPDGTIIGAVEVFHDDSARRALSDRLDGAQSDALTDPLTGLANRRQLGRVLLQRHDDYRRYDTLFAVIFADVDHFKGLNDTHGHDVGDRVLHLVGSTLRDCTRTGDTPGRWGGDEFLIVAAVADHSEARVVAERARRLVSSGWISVDDEQISVTLSVGVAVIRPSQTVRELVDDADRAMLTAKAAGRDRTAQA